MLQRDRDSLRAFREEEEARERLEAEERERPIREATEKLRETHRKLALIERERLTTIPDPERWLDPAVGPDTRMTERQAADFNRSQAHLYRESHPEIFWGDGLLDLLAAYFNKEQLRLITSSMIERLVERFAAVGLLPERPAEPEPEPTIEEEQPIVATEPQTHVGIDPLTGSDREYTEREVARMTADEFRRAFKITKAAITLPTRAAF